MIIYLFPSVNISYAHYSLISCNVSSVVVIIFWRLFRDMTFFRCISFHILFSLGVAQQNQQRGKRSTGPLLQSCNENHTLQMYTILTTRTGKRMYTLKMEFSIYITLYSCQSIWCWSFMGVLLTVVWVAVRQREHRSFLECVLHVRQCTNL